MSIQDVKFTFVVNNTELNAEAQVTYIPYTPARTVGLPEDCYQATEATLEIHSLKLMVPDRDAIDITYLLVELPSLKEDLEQQIYANLSDT